MDAAMQVKSAGQISALMLLQLGSTGMHAFSHHMSRLRHTSTSRHDVSNTETLQMMCISMRTY